MFGPHSGEQVRAIQKALAEHVQLVAEEAALKQRITLEVTNAYNAFFALQERLMRYENVLLPKGQDIAEKSRHSFEAGKSDILVSLHAQQAYINIRLGHLQAMRDLQESINDLEKATGSSL